MSNYSVYDRPLDAARREASIGLIPGRIPDLTPFFALTGGICIYREGILYYREGVNSPCSGPPKTGSRHCMAVARAIISPRASQGGKIELN